MTADWGESWASYPNFDLCLDQLIEKSNRLSKFLSERAQAQIDYAKKLREIAQKHQQKYNLIHSKHEKSKNNQHTSHIAFLRLVLFFHPGAEAASFLMQTVIFDDRLNHLLIKNDIALK